MCTLRPSGGSTQVATVEDVGTTGQVLLRGCPHRSDPGDSQGAGATRIRCAHATEHPPRPAALPWPPLPHASLTSHRKADGGPSTPQTGPQGL